MGQMPLRSCSSGRSKKNVHKLKRRQNSGDKVCISLVEPSSSGGLVEDTASMTLNAASVLATVSPTSEPSIAGMSIMTSILPDFCASHFAKMVLPEPRTPNSSEPFTSRPLDHVRNELTCLVDEPLVSVPAPANILPTSSIRTMQECSLMIDNRNSRVLSRPPTSTVSPGFADH